MKAADARVLEFGQFRLDLDEHSLVRHDGLAVPLTPRVFETLRYLVEHSGRVLEKHEMMDAVWADCVVEENNLAQAISKLRQVLRENGELRDVIQTVPGRGYKFVAPAPQASAAALPSRRKWLALAAAVVALAVAGAGLALRQGRDTIASAIPAKSIAVLPFENLSDDKQNAYFVTGVQDEILSHLARIADLKVISRTSANLYPGRRDVREIGQQLGVAHLLEGSVQRAGDRLRIHVQLVDARSDFHLWAETYERELSDIFAVQGEIAHAVARQLQATLTHTQKSALFLRPTTNFAAYEAYLKGRYFWNKRTPEGYAEAVAHFRDALELDANFAQAYVGLADASTFLADYEIGDQRAATENARSLLQQALALDDTLADAHASLGLLAMNRDWDWNKAEASFQRAIERNPNYATAHQWYGEFLVYMGRREEAFREINLAHELDPLSLIISSDVAKVSCLARRYDEAIVQLERTLKIDPDFAEARAILAVALAAQGRDAEAVAATKRIANLENHPIHLSWVAWIHARGGRLGEAHAAIERLNELATRAYVSPLWMATAWSAVDEEEAFRWLERVFAERSSSGGVSLKVNPLFDPLRSDPRFDDLLRRAHFLP